MTLLIQLLETPPKNPGHFPIWALAVLVLGFIAAVTIGGYAWKNSRPPATLPEKDVPEA